MRSPSPFKSAWFLAICGIVVTAAIYTHWSYYDYTKPASAADIAIGIAEIILCPPSLLLVLCIDCEVGTSAGLQTFLMIAVLNGGLYWLIATLVKRLSRM